jgi:hypothetical protein
MHKAFPDWYQFAAIKPTADMLAKRWSAVEDMAKWEERSLLVELARLVRGTCPADAPIRNSITEAARAHDAAFSARDNDAELRVLAGATIGATLASPSDKADLVSLALVSATVQDTQGDELVREFCTYARKYLADEAIGVRSAGARPPVPEQVDLNGALATFREAMGKAGDHRATTEPTAAFVPAAAAAARALVHQQVQHLYVEIDSLREESNMFWWVFSGHSRDLDRSFKELGVPASCLVAAKELSDLTTLFPGPRASSALLARVLRDADGGGAADLRISAAVNAAPRPWRSTWLERCPPPGPPELTPLLCAAQKSLDTDDPNDWISAFSKAAAVEDLPLAPHKLAMQAYVECVLSLIASKIK